MNDVIEYTLKNRFQFMMPETMLKTFLQENDMVTLLTNEGVSTKMLLEELDEYLNKVERVPNHIKMKSPHPSIEMAKVINEAYWLAEVEDKPTPLKSHYLRALINTDGSVANKILRCISADKLDAVATAYTEICEERESQETRAEHTMRHKGGEEPEATGTEEGPEPQEALCYRVDGEEEYMSQGFAGREAELEKSAMIICKQNRGNIIYVGDHGVGKSAMLAGLAQYVARMKKNSKLGKARIYKLASGGILGGSMYADECAKRILMSLQDGPDGSICILYIDNITDLAPQNSNDNTPDVLKILTEVTDGTNLRIVTTATYEQYKRMSAHNEYLKSSYMRIDIAEPALEPDGYAMVEAVAGDNMGYHELASMDRKLLRHIIDVANTSMEHDIAMPGRAIDLLDNVGALIAVEKSKKKGDMKYQPVQSEEIVSAVMEVLGIGNIATKVDEGERLKNLEANIASKIYGQSEAVHGVSETVLMAKAGLTDEEKPLAAYLFVGPTGVGKTELAKVLAKELDVELVRFDMSEYSEQHSVAKLVGSPAGYVGYEDGGLLTDAVRKKPNCVLLFDEIEKAHTSIFNLLLQVLDYGQLTDNKGQKANFRNCIIIMTSNAGARFATNTGLGFGARSEKGEVMMGELKRVFAPEFLNRLTQIVAFHDMDRQMAEMILKRKIGELEQRLQHKRGISLKLDAEATELLIKEGYSTIYGAREMDRAIGKLLKPVLTREILFGDMEDGGEIHLKVADGDIVVDK